MLDHEPEPEDTGATVGGTIDVLAGDAEGVGGVLAEFGVSILRLGRRERRRYQPE